MTEVDILKYIDDNKLIKTYGVNDGDYSISIDPFEYKVNDDYTIKYESGSTFSIYDKNDDYVDFFYYDTDGYTNYLDEGDTTTFKVEQSIITDTSLLIKESTLKITVKANKVMTADEAKDNLDKITDSLSEYIDKYYSRFTSYSPAEVYYVQPKDTSSDAKAYILVIEKGKYEGWSKDYDNYYYGFYIENPYMVDDKVYSTNMGSRSGNEKLADYKKYESLLKSDDYTNTKISK